MAPPGSACLDQVKMLAMQAEAAEWQAKALRMEAEALKNAHKNDVLANSIRQAPAKSVAAKPELLVVKEQPTEPEAHFRGTPPPWTAFAFIHDRYTGDGQCSGCSYEGQLMSSAGEEPHCGWCWVDFCTKLAITCRTSRSLTSSECLRKRSRSWTVQLGAQRQIQSPRTVQLGARRHTPDWQSDCSEFQSAH